MRLRPSLACCGLVLAAASSSSPGSAGPTRLPRNVVPIYAPSVGPFSDACKVTPTLHYLGGQVISNVNIVSVLWTANVDPDATTQLPKFYDDLMKSSYFDLLQEYHTSQVTPVDTSPGTTQGIGRGKYDKQYTITPSVCPGTTACTVTDTQIQAELAAQIAAKKLPEPELGCDGTVTSLYVIEFPVTVSISLTLDGTTSSSCSSFCGYHNHATIGGKVVPYGVIPSFAGGQCATTCSLHPPASLADYTSVHSHEVAEAVTDTDVAISGGDYVRPSAWGDENCGEIGDICNFQEQATTLNGAAWTVQQLWSNLAANCVVTSSAPPVCTAANTPAGCRACDCSDDAYAGTPATLGCDGKTPFCASGKTDVKAGYCVECTETSQCKKPDVCKTSMTAADDDVCVCQPLTKCPKGDDCGSVSDGCGKKIDCGTCTAPETCGGGPDGKGSPNVCGCTPLTACPSTQACGTAPDGCGGTITCGTCADGASCSDAGACPAGDAGRPGDDAGADGGAADSKSSAGCGCRTAGSTPTSTGGALALLALAGALARRLRRPRGTRVAMSLSLG